MKINVAPLQHLMEESHLGENNTHTKTHGVSIILIIGSNMSYIDVLTSTNNLSIGRKFRVHPHARLKSLLQLIWNVE